MEGNIQELVSMALNTFGSVKGQEDMLPPCLGLQGAPSPSKTQLQGWENSDCCSPRGRGQSPFMLSWSRQARDRLSSSLSSSLSSFLFAFPTPPFYAAGSNREGQEGQRKTLSGVSLPQCQIVRKGLLGSSPCYLPSSFISLPLPRVPSTPHVSLTLMNFCI